VNLGEPLSFVCRASKVIESCSIKFESIGRKARSFRVLDGATRAAFSYQGKGFKNGDCGIKYWNTSLDMQGNVTCSVGFSNVDLELVASAKLEVRNPSNRVYLLANNKHFEFNENDEMSFLCTADKAADHSPPNISLFLGMHKLFLNVNFWYVELMLN
jgi:hypothetical protein